ncbi:hypothetical protein O181_037706 [Austropuccinia psidii MF-1]|uniref:Uncharacterized protein n=1 Tax=Austropuccinia psidii MF-1 TaxID=1389203 RepID=A0A9Q3DCM7_9BASI|nr:hypothetical protein [Austropuccinia psidii MF-1]
MTPIRSGSNYSIQSIRSGPGHSGHKSKRQECQPRGEAQMEDARTSTSSQRPEPFPKGNNRDIPVSVQELKNRGPYEGLDTHFLKRTSTTDKSLVEKLKNFVRGPEEEVSPRKGQKPCGSSPSHHKQECTSKSAKQGQGIPKSEGKSKGKGKGKGQLKQTLPTELQNSKQRKESHGQCVQYGKNSDGIKKQGGGKNEPILLKEIDL